MGVRIPVDDSRADCGRGLQSVHLGHLYVHQNDVELLRPRGLNRFTAGIDHHNRVAALFENARGKTLIDQVVLGQQDA